MKDEIKEILKQCDGVVKREIPLLILAPEYTQLLLDYIENLQEENKMYAQLKDEYEDIINKAIERAIHIQETFGYELSDLIFLLQRGMNNE